jgi:hypothetical protein
MLMLRNRTIQIIVEMYPLYTSGSTMDHPRDSIERSDVVAMVKGRPRLM